MAYQLAAMSMTLSHFQGHSFIARISNAAFFLAVVQQLIRFQPTEHHVVPRIYSYAVPVTWALLTYDLLTMAKFLFKVIVIAELLALGLCSLPTWSLKNSWKLIRNFLCNHAVGWRTKPSNKPRQKHNLLAWSDSYTEIDNDVICSFCLCQLFWPPWCRARKCKHIAALTVRSPRWRKN